MKLKFTLLLLLICLMSCNQNDTLNSTEYYNVPNYSVKNNKINFSSIDIDTLKINSDIESSFTGFFFIKDDELYFADILFNYVYEYNSSGKFINRYLGKGNGLNETLGFQTAVVSKDNFHFLNEITSEITHYDNNFDEVRRYEIDWQINRSKQEVLSNPNPLIGDAYEFDYTLPDIFQIWDEENFAIAVTTSHPTFNGYFNTNDYYNNSRILAIVNIKSGKVVDLIGRRPPLFLKYKNLPNFDHFTFDLVDENVYINFRPDSTIYIINKQSNLAIGKFGSPGKNMKTDYVTTQDYNQAHHRWNQDNNDFGYYYYLKYSPIHNLLFRGYKKGYNACTDGLQIYSNFRLLADIDVPIGLKIIGNIGNDLIASGKVDDEHFEIYKITLNYEK